MKAIETLDANVNMFDEYYHKPTWWFKWRYDTQMKRKTILALLRNLNVDLASKKVFELGFGSGEVLFSFPLSSQLYGVELSHSAVDKATERASSKGYAKFEFSLLKPDGTYPVENSSMDIVIASHVLEHVESLEKCLSEIKRILKVNGLLVVLVPINETYDDPHHCRKFTLDTCRQAGEKAGLTFVNGFENELLYHLVEKLYLDHVNKPWGIGGNVVRIAFNILTAPLPFGVYRLYDRIVGSVFSLPPKQAGLVFRKDLLR